jgi:hypothetical protein
VDGILLLCDQRKTNIEKALAKFSEQQPTIKFAIEKELHNFLDLSVHCRDKEFEFTIYRKPT